MSSNDPYVYPGTNVLINLADIRDGEELARFEADVVMQSFKELLWHGVPGELGAEWYRSVHAGLFGAAYPWAGTFRTIDIFKEGEPPYADARFLDEQAAATFGSLKAENNLRGLERGIFVARLAIVMGDLHVLHPFREGNTRTLQIATAEIAHRAGHSLAWQRADPTTIRSAGTAAVFFDFEPYRKILLEIYGKPHNRVSE